jgi:iron complex outermembrane receptor protein
MIALAGFYKEVKTYIYNQTIDFDFSSVPNPLGRKIPSTIGKLTTPQNGDGGWIKGYEFQAKLDFGDFVPVLDGFGFDGSYSRNFTNIHPNGPGTTATLPGFSGISRSLTAYYEKHGFQARISERWRSASRSDVAGLFATRTFTQILPDTQVDAQISYKFSEGALNGMSVMLQATNLTDAPYRTGAGIAADGSYLPEVYEKYGARYILGVSYKF